MSVLVGVKTKRNLLANPSFEVWDGANQPHGWTVGGTTTDIVENAGTGVADYANSLRFQSGGSITQQVAITPASGVVYELSFSQLGGIGGKTQAYSVQLVGGTSSGQFLQGNGTWGASNTLTFTTTNPLSQFLTTFTPPPDATGLIFSSTGNATAGNVWMDQVFLGHSGDSTLDDFQAFNSLISPRKAEIVEWARNMLVEPLFYSGETAILSSLGATPMLLLGPGTTNLSDYTGGTHDAILTSLASSAVSYGATIYADFAEEFNGNWASYGYDGGSGEGAASFIAGWRYVVNFFRTAGATNIKWVWSPSVFTPGQATGAIVDPSPFYPGDAYVDLIGWHGYASASNNVSFSTLFSSDYTALAGLSASRPIFISQTGCGRTSLIDKAAWFTAMGSSIAANSFPRLAGVLFWNENNSIADGDVSHDFTINNQGDTPAAAAALSAVVNSAPFISSNSQLPGALLAAHVI